MKKILTSLFALAAVFCASAEVPTYEVSPENGSTLENRHNLTVTFTFSEAVKADSIQYSGGARSNRTLTTVPFEMASPSKTITVDVPDSVWGVPYCGEYILSVTLANISDNEGNPIQIPEEDPETGKIIYQDYVASGYYVSPDKTPAQYKGVDPDPAYTSAWDAYLDGWGMVELLFDNVAECSEDEEIQVLYTKTDGYIISETVWGDELEGDWSIWDQRYHLGIPLPPADITEETLAKITINVSGITSYGINVSIPKIEYSNVAPQVQMKKAPATAGITSVNISEFNGNVYNMHGILIKESATSMDVQNLPKGMYIVNGKKVVVK